MRVLRTPVLVSLGEEDGPPSIGGIIPHMFAEGGETSYLDRHPSWGFASFVHLTGL